MVDNINIQIMVYMGGVKLYKFNQKEKKLNMDTKKYIVVACLDEGVVSFLNKDNKEYFDVDINNSFDGCFGFFPFHTSRKRILREPWVGNLLSTMVMLINVGGMIPISTSIITINR